MRQALLLLVVLLAGCASPNDATTYAPAVVDLHKVTSKLDSNGLGHVIGEPGAVTGGHADSVSIVIMRNGPPPAALSYGLEGTAPKVSNPLKDSVPPSALPAKRHLLHLTAGTPIASATAPVASDGSFTEVTLGSTTVPLVVGDEVNLTPEQGDVQVGFTAVAEIF